MEARHQKPRGTWTGVFTLHLRQRGLAAGVAKDALGAKPVGAVRGTTNHPFALASEGWIPGSDKVLDRRDSRTHDPL